MVVCYVYMSLDSLRFRARSVFRSIAPLLISWSESVAGIFSELNDRSLDRKTISVAKVNSLCDDVNDILARLSRSGDNSEELADRFALCCAEIFNEAYDYNEAVLAYNKKLSAPLYKAVAGFLKMKAPERLSELLFR